MVIPAIGAVAAAGANYFGQRSANRENVKYQHDANKTQMEFQERMSNTAYQRAMADMQKAGLNPILAYSQGGAGSSSGSSAAPTVTNKAAPALHSGFQAKQLSAQVDQIRAMTDLARAELPEKLATAKLYSGTLGPVLSFLKTLGSGVLPAIINRVR